MNNITLMGRLGHDPSLKTTDSGVDIVEVSLATNHQRKQGDEWVKETIWHRLKVIGKRAAVIKQYVVKGDQLLVMGRQENKPYEDKDGNKRISTEVIVNDFEFVSSNAGRVGDSNEAKVAESPTSHDSNSGERVNHAPEPTFNQNEPLPF